MAKQLTAKQELFCQHVASGKSYSDAYKLTYNVRNNTENTIRTEAYKLTLKQEIRDRIKTLMKPIEDKMVVEGMSERENQLALIRERIQVCKDNEDETNLYRYIDMLNKIYGLYKDSGTDTKTDNNKLDKIDDSMLKKLVAI